MSKVFHESAAVYFTETFTLCRNKNTSLVLRSATWHSAMSRQRLGQNSLSRVLCFYEHNS